MGLDATARRRWFGSLALLAALAMLVAGETVLKHRLGEVAFLAYWLGCFLLTVLAITTALLDVRALRRRARKEQQDLLQNALHDIASEAEPPQRRTRKELRHN